MYGSWQDETHLKVSIIIQKQNKTLYKNKLILPTAICGKRETCIVFGKQSFHGNFYRGINRKRKQFWRPIWDIKKDSGEKKLMGKKRQWGKTTSIHFKTRNIFDLREWQSQSAWDANKQPTCTRASTDPQKQCPYL